MWNPSIRQDSLGLYMGSYLPGPHRSHAYRHERTVEDVIADVEAMFADDEEDDDFTDIGAMP